MAKFGISELAKITNTGKKMCDIICGIYTTIYCMVDSASNSMSGRYVGKTPIERLLMAIGYPERMSKNSVAFTLRVDGAEVEAEEMDGRLVLSCALTDDETLLPTLATYAAGRMLREDATLSYGVAEGRGPSNYQAFLWQDVPDDTDEHGLLRLFETFMDSCDWWRARVEALRGNDTAVSSVPETVMIRP